MGGKWQWRSSVCGEVRGHRSLVSVLIEIFDLELPTRGAVAWLRISFRCMKTSLGSRGGSEAKCTHGA